MIDVHCHLEQKDYDGDREATIEKCRKELDAVVTSCAHPRDLDLTLDLVERYGGFVFASVGIHPEYIKEVSGEEEDAFFDVIKMNRDRIVGIGEVGLDYHWVREDDWRERQRELFVKFIAFSKELKLPLIVHVRDAFEDAVRILEREDARNVLMHMFGANDLVEEVVKNGWFVSLNRIILSGKKYRKVARDVPVDRLLLETDSPWLGLGNGRNDPTGVRSVAEKISEIKKITFDEVDRTTTRHAIEFFNLDLHSNKLDGIQEC